MIGQIPARCRSATSLGPVCDQDSVVEFGINSSIFVVHTSCRVVNMHEVYWLWRHRAGSSQCIKFADIIGLLEARGRWAGWKWWEKASVWLWMCDLRATDGAVEPRSRATIEFTSTALCIWHITKIGICSFQQILRIMSSWTLPHTWSWSA